MYEFSMIVSRAAAGRCYRLDSGSMYGVMPGCRLDTQIFDTSIIVSIVFDSKYRMSRSTCTPTYIAVSHILQWFYMD
jgi:hypothetical protein